MSDKYILEGKKAVPCNDIIAWGKYFQTADRKVAKDSIGDVDISTVFLGLDHNWGDGPPLLFETLVFGGSMDGEMERYPSWTDAVMGHKRMVKLVKEKANKPLEMTQKAEHFS